MFPLDALGPSGLAEPYEDLLDPLIPPPIAFWSWALDTGENVDPDMFPPLGLPFLDSGDSP